MAWLSSARALTIAQPYDPERRSALHNAALSAVSAMLGPLGVAANAPAPGGFYGKVNAAIASARPPEPAPAPARVAPPRLEPALAASFPSQYRPVLQVSPAFVSPTPPIFTITGRPIGGQPVVLTEERTDARTDYTTLAIIGAAALALYMFSR